MRTYRAGGAGLDLTMHGLSSFNVAVRSQVICADAVRAHAVLGDGARSDSDGREPMGHWDLACGFDGNTATAGKCALDCLA